MGAVLAATLAAYARAGAGGGADAARQDPASLEAAARAAAAGVLPPLTDKQRLQAGPVRADLDLPRCAAPVRPVIASGAHMKDRVTVQLVCDAPAPWHIYVPVRVVGFSAVVVAAHAIVMGTVITADDLRVEQHDVTELPAGFLDSPSIAIGLSAARPISGGAVLTNQQLNASKAVERGQAVTLVADAGGMSIRMAGRALSDGYVNQRVRVQNLSSGKVVEGVARSAQIVEIIFQ